MSVDRFFLFLQLTETAVLMFQLSFVSSLSLRQDFVNGSSDTAFNGNTLDVMNVTLYLFSQVIPSLRLLGASSTLWDSQPWMTAAPQQQLR